MAGSLTQASCDGQDFEVTVIFVATPLGDLQLVQSGCLPALNLYHRFGFNEFERFKIPAESITIVKLERFPH